MHNGCGGGAPERRPRSVAMTTGRSPREHGPSDSLSRTMGLMGHSVVNGDRWIAERLAHLQTLLAGELSQAQREAIESEIAALNKERGIVLGGLRLPRWFRRWRRTERNGT